MCLFYEILKKWQYTNIRKSLNKDSGPILDQKCKLLDDVAFFNFYKIIHKLSLTSKCQKNSLNREEGSRRYCPLNQRSNTLL